MRLADLAKEAKLIVTPLQRAWLEKQGTNPTYTKEGKQLIRDALINPHKPMAGPRLFRASDAGQCGRRRLLHRLGVKPSRKPALSNIAVMRSGIWAHARWQADGLSAGWLQPGSCELPLYDPKGRYRMKLDGVLKDLGYPFELKTSKPGGGTYSYDMVKASGRPLRPHQLQAAYGAVAMDAEAAVVVYENRADLQFLEFVVEITPQAVQAVNDDVGPLVHALNEEELPPMLSPCVSKSGVAYNTCDWRDQCPLAEQLVGPLWAKAKEVMS